MATRPRKNVSVTVNHKASILKVTPELRNVRFGGTVTIKTVPAKGKDKAHTKQAPGTPRWLTGHCNRKGEIVLPVPENALGPRQKEKTYKYSVTVDGVGTIDPRVRVIR